MIAPEQVISAGTQKKVKLTSTPKAGERKKTDRDERKLEKRAERDGAVAGSGLRKKARATRFQKSQKMPGIWESATERFVRKQDG